MVKPKLNGIESKIKDQNQKFEKQIQNLTEKLIALKSDRLGKQLEGVNQTLQNQKLYGMDF